MSEKGDAGDVERGVLELGLKEEQNRNESTPADLVSLPGCRAIPPLFGAAAHDPKSTVAP